MANGWTDRQWLCVRSDDEESRARLERIYAEIPRELNLHHQLAMVAALAREIMISWKVYPEDWQVEAAVVVGTETNASVTVAARRRAIDTWPVFVEGMAAFPLAQNSLWAQEERRVMLRALKKERDY